MICSHALCVAGVHSAWPRPQKYEESPPMPEVDHIYPASSADDIPTVLLYANIANSGFAAFHSKLKHLAEAK